MMLLAQASPWDAPATIGAWLGCLLFAVMLFNALGKAYDRFTGKSKVPQPMNVEIVKALHEQFADKGTFEKHVAHSTSRHAQIFASIERVEKEAREAMDARFTQLSEERQATLEKLTNQLSFIRESIVEVKTELRLRNK